MLSIRRADERGHYQNDWLDSRHSFSFGEYYDPEHMGVSLLRVINDDRIAPSGGFATHPHRDMEIVTYVLEGELEHKDSIGNGSVIRPGDVQRMSAGTGVTHSEFNPSDTNPGRFLQIWLLPARKGIEPGYEQKTFADGDKRARLKLLVSPDGGEGSVSATTDVRLYGSLLEAGESVAHQTTPGRMAYVHVARGSILLDGTRLDEGDAATATAPGRLLLEGGNGGEILLFDLPREA